MVKIDLITGFLGSGKTTFLKKYVKYCISQGENICILENDYGAVNVDMMLLQDLPRDKCDMEMVAGGCDKDCHIRRFKTKLIAMGMCGYDRVIVEPSGIFDMDEFFDVLREDPLERWYQIDNIFAIVDANLPAELSEASEYMLASQVANAGTIIFSKVQELDAPAGKCEKNLDHLRHALTALHANKDAFLSLDHILWKDWKKLTDEDFQDIRKGGYHNASYVKKHNMDEDTYQSLYFMHLSMEEDELKDKVLRLFADDHFGKVIRVKGFMKKEDSWIELNAVKDKMTIQPIANGQEIIIVIGENMNKAELESYWTE